MTVGGAPSPIWTPELTHEYRLRAVEFLERACGAPIAPQVLKSDPGYTIVTEGRDRTPAQQKIYSSCADLAHALFEYLGVLEPWVNRAGKPGGFVYGANVSRLTAHSWPYVGEKLEGGDVLEVWNRADTRDAHVVCVIDQPSLEVLDTAEYGASGMRVGGIGGHLCRRALRGTPTRISKPEAAGGRIVRRVLPLERVLIRAWQAGRLRGGP